MAVGSGYNYEINPLMIGQPQVAPQVPPQAAATAQAAVENDPLALRGKMTSDYYNNYGMLQSFVKDMMSKGIDPTVPDYSQEGGGMPFQLFHKLQAGVLYAANALSNEFKAETQMRPYEAQGLVGVKQGVDRNGLYSQNAENWYSTQPTYATQELNRRLGQNTDTLRDQNALNAEIAPYLQQVDQQVAAGILSPEQGEIQKQSIMRNVYTTKLFAPRDPRDSPGFKYAGNLNLLQKYTNLGQGVWGKEASQPMEINGKVYVVNTEGQGDILGRYLAGQDSNGNPIYKDKVVKQWRKDPDSGQVFIDFTDPNISPVDASSLTGDALAMQFISNNPKYGSVDKMNEAMAAVGVGNGLGGSVNEIFMPPNADELRNQSNESAKAMSERIKVAKENIKKELSDLENPLTGWSYVTYTLPDKRQVVIGKHKGTKDKFFIDNKDEVKRDFEINKTDKLDYEQVLSVLSQIGYFNRDKYTRDSPAPQQVTPQQNDLKAKADALKAKYGIKK
jgi:hypothetical protein